MEEPKLDKALHIKYFQRCLKSVLPTVYTSNDSSRIALACFILSGLDLLGAGPDTFSEDEKEGVKNWFLSCQCRSGGFAGNPGLRFDDASGDNLDKNEKYEEKPWLDGASVPMTYFALLGLAMVDGLQDVRRGKCLRWLKSLQRNDDEAASGGFGETSGLREGDMRNGHCGGVIRWILGAGDKGWEDEEGDIDVEGFVRYIRDCQTYDGGISESALHESHGGYTYCAIASLSILDRLPTPPSFKTCTSGKSPGLTNVKSTIRWLMGRQLAYIAVDEDSDESSDDDEQQQKLEAVKESPPKPDAGQTEVSAAELPSLIPQTMDECYYVGQNGRCNKPVDTCYSFWNCASLDILGQSKLLNRDPIRRFLLEQTQHRIGGFGKSPGDPPDIYHSFLALAALATMKEPGLKELDSSLCASMDTKKKIEEFKDKRGKSETRKNDEGSFFELLDGMAKAGIILRGKGKGGDELEEMEKEKERLLARARKLKV